MAKCCICQNDIKDSNYSYIKNDKNQILYFHKLCQMEIDAIMDTDDDDSLLEDKVMFVFDDKNRIK